MAQRRIEADPFKYRIRFLILSLLAIKPTHGYELSKRIEKITKGLIKGGPGSIYPVLKELKEDGLLDEDLIVEKGRAKKIYRLTREGAAILYNELNGFYDIANTLIEIATEARKRLQSYMPPHTPRGCPPSTILEKLERLRDTIQEYISVLKERIEECNKKVSGRS